MEKSSKIINVLVPSHCPLPIAPIAQCSGLVGHLQAEQIGRPSLPLFSRTGPISGNQHLLTNFLSYKMYGKDNNAMQRVFQVHIFQGGKRRFFLKIGRRMKCHWFPPLARILPQEFLASGRMNTNVNSTIAQSHCSQLYHYCPVPAFSTSALRNSWTYQQSVSPGLTPTVTRKWSPLVCNELMKHPWKCTVCTVHRTRHTIACD